MMSFNFQAVSMPDLFDHSPLQSFADITITILPRPFVMVDAFVLLTVVLWG
jgi:hypothetical protein